MIDKRIQETGTGTPLGNETGLSATPSKASALAEYPELRVSTITPASRRLLERIGAWHHVAPPRAGSFHKMVVWDSNPRGPGVITYNAQALGHATMAHVIENSVLQAGIRRTLVENTKGDNICDFYEGASLKTLALPPYGIDVTGPLVSISLDDGRQISASLLIGADGAQSSVRETAGIRCLGHSYDQRAVVATVALEEGSPLSVAWQKFLPTGPVALLPVRDGFANIVWSTTPEIGEILVNSSAEKFVDMLNSALSTASVEVPKVTAVLGQKPASFPLQLRHAGKYVGPRLALIGDAAHVVHPLAGQGVNMGFGDVQVLQAALARAVSTGIDLGNSEMLERTYEIPRMRANGAMSSVLDGFAALFPSEDRIVSTLRTTGLKVLDSIPWAKNAIMRYAMFN